MVFIYFLGAEPQGLNILNKLYHCAISPVLSLCLKGHKTYLISRGKTNKRVIKEAYSEFPENGGKNHPISPCTEANR